MTLSKITYKGIARAGSDQQVQDGYLEEAINTRHREGKLTARGKITKLYELPSNTYDKIWLHDQDDIYNFIGYVKSTGQLQMINMETGAEPFITLLSPGEDANVLFIKRFMIVISELRTLTYLFYEGAYVSISKPPVPVIQVEAINQEMIYSDDNEVSDLAESIRGYYYKNVNKQSSKYSKQTGGMMYRIAYRMFDGSYIMHTLPRFLDLGIEMAITGDGSHSGYRFVFSVANVQVTINPSNFTGINPNIFTDVMIFASKCCNLFDISEDAIDDDTISDADDAGTIMHSDQVVGLSLIDTIVDEDFKNMIKSGSWYRIYQKSIEDIQKESDSFSEVLDSTLFNQDGMQDYYQDYANRETLPVDQFSHHKISGTRGFAYNDRLLLGDIRTVFGQYPISLQELTNTTTNTYAQQRKGVNSVTATAFDTLTTNNILTLEGVTRSNCKMVFEFTIDIPGKKIKVYKEMTNQPFYIKTDNSYYYFVLPEVIGYPDSRASKVRLLYYDESNTRYIEVGSFSLTKSSNNNFSFYHEPVSITESTETSGIYSPQTPFKFILVSIATSTFSSKVVTLSETEDYIDSNRVQASELQNPIFFPSKNSYQVGTGRILALAANTEPLSTGQFGEYPLAVFTSKGIWTLLQGSGDVLFSNILPLNGEVPSNPDQITPLSVGVVYSTERGLYLISGREVKNLSEVLTGQVNLHLQANAHYQYFLNHDNIVQLLPYLSQIDAKMYISGAKVGYDKLNNELIVTNFDQSYSYVYSFESGYWYKTTDRFRLLVNAYPKLLGVNDSGIHSLSDEDFTGSVQVLLTTRPIKLTDDSFKLIRRSVQRCQLNTTDGKFAAFYMFASNDLRKWQLITGNDRKEGYVTDIMISRAHTKAKYFIFVLTGDLEENSMINDIDVEFDPVLQNRLR